jgi:bacillithiol synthase
LAGSRTRGCIALIDYHAAVAIIGYICCRLPANTCQLKTADWVYMAKVQDIPFRSIPHQSSLFLSYIDFAPAALRFYRGAPTLENLTRTAKDLVANRQFPRSEIVSILRRQNESFGIDAETARNIDCLERSDCAAILTGQQVGLFTGPIYTIYKALAAIRIAEELKSRGILSVPVFWMETEDHDLPEATRRTLASADHSVGVTDYGDMLFKDAEVPQGSVGRMQFPENIRQVVQHYLDHLPDTVWKQEIRLQLETACRPGATFAQSFAQLLSGIFRGSGLILFDPHCPDAKRLARGILQKAIRDADVIRHALLERNKDLEAAGFHAQVSVLENSTVLFYFQDGARYALEKKGSGFSLKNSHGRFSVDSLIQCAEQSPEKFSPNVLLRPLIQDHLFPTAAYVGGSAEVAYFAQIEVLYKTWNRPMPIIWPRNSFTLLEPGISAELDRLGIDVQDCFRGRQCLTEKALSGSGCLEAASNLETLQERLDQGLAEIRPEIELVDATLATALETARRKILHNVQRLKSHLIQLEATKDSRISKSLDLLMNHCFPNQKLQERELGIQHFWVRHGASVLDALRSSLEVECFSHRVLLLPPAAGEKQDQRTKGVED